jgi:predicted glycogen debranching enzyme
MIDFGRDICGDLADSSRREWLVTNGIGGYASSTISGEHTRRYHGLLVAALKPPLGRTLMVSDVDETAYYAGSHYALGTNRWESGSVDPRGFTHIERFWLDGSIPVWTFAIGDALLEKRVWMEIGANTTYVQYTLARGTQRLELDLKVLVNYRDYHSDTHAGDWHMNVETLKNGLKVTAFDGATPMYLFSDHAEVSERHDWYRGYFSSVEAYRGLGATDDNLHAGDFKVDLEHGESVTLVFSTDAKASLDGQKSYAARRDYEEKLIKQSGLETSLAWIKHLVLASDQFIVQRPLENDPDGRSIIAGYPWFGDWGRDTMIALPGLTLATGRFADAEKILRTFARFIDQGMLPNRFPDADETPEYNTVDATLWYFEAIRAYLAATHDEKLLRDLFPVLEDIISWHQKGTRYNIHVDQDGLLYGGEAGVQLTWMDAKIGDYVVTPRIGKPVEINALWYNALSSMSDFATQLGKIKAAKTYAMLAQKAKEGFARFWNNDLGYLYDVLDTPHGDDSSLRSNQLFAVSLPYSPLSPDQQRSVVDVCARRLLTSHGLRSLSKDDPAFVGHYGGNPYSRDTAYHQGTVWSWLLGTFVSAHYRVYGDVTLAQSFLAPLEYHLQDAGLGNISEIFDGDAPFTPRGCFAQAWSVGEVLRAYRDLQAVAPSLSKPVQRLRKKATKRETYVNV